MELHCDGGAGLALCPAKAAGHGAVTDCPTCGGAVKVSRGLVLRGGRAFTESGSVKLGPVKEAIVRILLSGPLTPTQLSERVYGNSPDQPVCPDGTIGLHILQLRRHLKPLGWTVGNVGVGAGGGSIHRLEPIT